MRVGDVSDIGVTSVGKVSDIGVTRVGAVLPLGTSEPRDAAAEQHKGGKIPDNVRQFVLKHYAEAQKLAASLGNGVTAAEVLAVAGNETGWGTSKSALQYGNFFGLHGSGTEGNVPAAGDPSVSIAKFPLSNGFLLSSQEFRRKAAPHMTSGLGNNPSKLFAVLHDKLKYAEPNSHYAEDMTMNGKRRGPYTLVEQCIKELGLR